MNKRQDCITIPGKITAIFGRAREFGRRGAPNILWQVQAQNNSALFSETAIQFAVCIT